MRRIISRLGVLFLGLMLAFVLAEGAVRLAGYRPNGPSTVDAAEFAHVPGIFTPSQEWSLRVGTPLSHHVTVDSLGYRGGEIGRRHAADELRVFLSGDSFVWGSYVEDDETLPAQLQRVLRSSCHDATVVNAGVPSTTILGESAMIERGLSLSPQVEVLVFVEGDLEDLRDVRTWERLAENRAVKSRFPMRVILPIARHMALFEFILTVRAPKRQPTPEARPDAATGAAPAASTGFANGRLDSAKAEYERILLRTEQLLRARGISLVFVGYPSFERVKTGVPAEDYRWALALAARHGLTVLDLLPVLRASGSEVDRLFLVPYDGHPNAQGYGLAAQALARAVRDLPVARPACVPVDARVVGASVVPAQASRVSPPVPPRAPPPAS